MSEFLPSSKYNITINYLEYLSQYPNKQFQKILEDIKQKVQHDFYYKGERYYNLEFRIDISVVELPKEFHKEMDTYLNLMGNFELDLNKIKQYLSKILNRSETYKDAYLLSEGLLDQVPAFKKDSLYEPKLSKEFIKQFIGEHKKEHDLVMQYKALRLVTGD